MHKKNYKKAGLSYTIGSFFNKGITFLTVPIFTRLLSTADYGTVSTYNSWVGIVAVIISMTLYMAIRQVYVEFPEKIDDYHSTITIFITIISSIALLLCICSGCAFSINILLPVLCIIQSYASALIENYSMYLMMMYQYKMRTAFMMLPNLISVIIAVIVIKFIMNEKLYLGRIIPTTIVTFVFGIFVIIAVFMKSRIFNKDYLKYSLAISVPLIVHGVALSILGQSDRTMISVMSGSDKTGIYSVVYNFGMIATALSTALTGIWEPWYLERLKSHTDEDFARINEMTKAYVLFMTMIMSGVILVAPEILRFMTTEPYWEGMSIIPPIVLANLFIFIYTFYANIEHFHKRTKTIAINTLVAAGSNIVLNYIFIPIYGYEAAAYTTIASYGISLLMHYVHAKKLEPKSTRLTEYAIECIVIIIISAIYYLALDFWIVRWLTAIVLAMVVILYLLRNYRYLMN